MISGRIAAALLAIGARVAGRAVAARRERLHAAVRDLTGIESSVEPNGLALSGRGLRARVFGTRTAPRDIRLLALLRTDR